MEVLNELGRAPELGSKDKGSALNKLPESELDTPKLEGILPGAKPKEEAKGKAKDLGATNPLLFSNIPKVESGIAKETLGKELGKKLEPGNEDIDHNGIQMGAVVNESEVSKVEPIG